MISGVVVLQGVPFLFPSMLFFSGLMQLRPSKKLFLENRGMEGSSPEPQEKNSFDEMMAPLLMKMYGANLAENCLFVGVQAYVVGNF